MRLLFICLLTLIILSCDDNKKPDPLKLFDYQQYNNTGIGTVVSKILLPASEYKYYPDPMFRGVTASQPTNPAYILILRYQSVYQTDVSSTPFYLSIIYVSTIEYNSINEGDYIEYLNDEINVITPDELKIRLNTIKGK